ncbi:MAG: hypothetical protein ACR2M3_14960 [Thermomicrobiales bacterium]
MQDDEREMHGDYGPRPERPGPGEHGPRPERPGPGNFVYRWAESGPQIPWPEMKRRMREAFREGFRPGDPEWRRFFKQFFEGEGQNGGPAGDNRRSNVLSLRVDDRTLAAIDSLVEAGLFATRAESATWLLQAGVASNTELFERINNTVSEIRRLREELQRQMNAATGAPQESESHAESQSGEQHEQHEYHDQGQETHHM